MRQQGTPATKLSRRGLLRGTLVAGAAAVAASAPSSLTKVHATGIQPLVDAALNAHHEPSPYSPFEHHVFMHSVASGDPLPTSVLLWTRVTPSPEAVPGSGIGEDVTVAWEVATEQSFVEIVAHGFAVATAEHDHTIHVDPFGLEPDRVYFYRFQIQDGPFAGTYSPTGRTRTAPADDATPRQLRLAVCSCANFESGYFTAYADIARRALSDEIDVVIHMGDYLYEYASGRYAGKHGVLRPHVPTWELKTLADYRSRYGHYRRDVALQNAHAAAPWIVTWDDHEIANDAWAGGAANHDAFKGPWESRRDAAMQAYMEWLPVRGQAPSRGGHIYRTLRFGTLAELHMLDLRSYRSAPGLALSAASSAPERTIMGSEQFEWLSGRLSTTSARWNLIGTSVMMAPLNLLNTEPLLRQPLTEMIGVDIAGTPINADQWDGYQADRQRLLAQLAQQHAHGRTLFLTGDIHSEWANHIMWEDTVIGAELVCTSISAPNVDDLLKLPADSVVSTTAERHVLRQNPHVAHVDFDCHGYSLLTLSAEGAHMRWLRVADVEVSGSAMLDGPTLLFDGSSITV